MKKIVLSLTVAAFTLFTGNTAVAQCSHSKAEKTHKSYDGGMDESAAMDIVDIAAGNESFSTLVAAVSAAGLADALKGDGPLTVFAPTNSAFSKVPAEALSSLLQPENIDQLTSILTYHVVAGSFDAETVLKAIENGGGKAEIATLNGGTLTAMLSDGKVMLKDAKGNISTVTQTDIKAANGIIHVIDTVVMP